MDCRSGGQPPPVVAQRTVAVTHNGTSRPASQGLAVSRRTVGVAPLAHRRQQQQGGATPSLPTRSPTMPSRQISAGQGAGSVEASSGTASGATTPAPGVRRFASDATSPSKPLARPQQLAGRRPTAVPPLAICPKPAKGAVAGRSPAGTAHLSDVFVETLASSSAERASESETVGHSLGALGGQVVDRPLSDRCPTGAAGEGCCTAGLGLRMRPVATPARAAAGQPHRHGGVSAVGVTAGLGAAGQVASLHGLDIRNPFEDVTDDWQLSRAADGAGGEGHSRGESWPRCQYADLAVEAASGSDAGAIARQRAGSAPLLGGSGYPGGCISTGSTMSSVCPWSSSSNVSSAACAGVEIPCPVGGGGFGPPPKQGAGGADRGVPQGQGRGDGAKQVFRRALYPCESAAVEALLAEPGFASLGESSEREFAWALSVGGGLPGWPGRIDNYSAFSAIQQLAYLNGLPAPELGAVRALLDHARNASAQGGGRDAHAQSADEAGVSLGELKAAVLRLMQFALAGSDRAKSATLPPFMQDAAAAAG